MELQELLSATKPQLLNWVWTNTQDLEYENYELFAKLSRKHKSIVYGLVTLQAKPTQAAATQLHTIYKKVYTNTTFSPHIVTSNEGNNGHSCIPLSKGKRYRLKQQLVTLDADELATIKELVQDILDVGISKYKHRLDIYNINYTVLTTAINFELENNFIEEEDLKLAFHVFGRISRGGGTFSLQSKIIRRLFKANVNEVMAVLIENEAIELVSNHLAGWKSKTYYFSSNTIDAVEVLATDKQVKLLKSIKMKKAEYTMEEKIELLEGGEVDNISPKDAKLLVAVMRKRQEGFNYLNNKNGIENLKASDVFANPGLFISFGLYYAKLMEDLANGLPFRTMDEYSLDTKN